MSDLNTYFEAQKNEKKKIPYQFLCVEMKYGVKRTFVLKRYLNL